MNNDVILNNGIKMPMFGLGTADPMHDIPKPSWVKGRWSNALYHRTFYKLHWSYRGYKLAFAVKNALLSGYRTIDTSASYKNGYFIKLGIKWSKVKREELFIITRISNQEQRNSSVEKSVNKSLKQLDMDYIDLFMFHWPVTDIFLDTWKEMEKVCEKGFVKSIGTANCHEHHLEKILEIATILPSVNEFEIHPLMSQDKLVKYCKSKNIVPMAYTPLGRMHEKIIENKDLKNIAVKYNKSIPQVVLKWHMQRNIPIIPRSINKKNIEKNIDIFDFELVKEEVTLIDNINEDLRLRYNPDTVDFTKC